MKTIKQCLMETDPDKLTLACYLKYPDDYTRETENENEPSDGDPLMWLNEINSFIEYLKSVEPSKEPLEDDNYPILFVCKTLWDMTGELSFEAVLKNEIDEAEDEYPITDYSQIPHAEMLRIMVSDAPLTQKYLLELLVDFIHQASVFGFKQEHMPEITVYPGDHCEEDENDLYDEDSEGSCFTHMSDRLDPVYSIFWTGEEKESPDERELHDRIIEAQFDYYYNSRRKELLFLADSISSAEMNASSSPR
ncbi:MAG: hypothetical protein IKR08_03870 [Firmicutes bacterium]|nr:hypothetical protein [Bacillota bacterium]